MATIKRTDRGQVVQHGYGYYYLADDFGNPASGGWLDLADAEAALDFDNPDAWPEADLDLDGRGNPANADDRFARIQWDEENDGVDEEAGADFAEALRAFLKSSPEEWDDQLWSLADPSGPTAIWVPVAEAKRFEAACGSLDGWGGGPEHAPNPLLFYYPAMLAYRFDYLIFGSQAVRSIRGAGADAAAALASALPGFQVDDPTRTTGFGPIVEAVESVRPMQDGRLAAIVRVRASQTTEHRPEGTRELWFRPVEETSHA